MDYNAIDLSNHDLSFSLGLSKIHDADGTNTTIV